MDVLLNNDVETVDFGETAMRVKLTREVIEVKEINDIGSVRILMLKGEKGDVGYPTDEQVYEAVDEWLTAHPEATTTVQDNSLTWVKFNDVLKNMMFKLGITDSKSGELVSTSDAAEFPLKDLQSEITATQNLNGYEYPWVGGAGVNQWNEDYAPGVWLDNGTFWANTNGYMSNRTHIPVQPNTQYRFVEKNTAYSFYICYYTEDKTFIRRDTLAYTDAATVITTPSNCYYVCFSTYQQYGTTYNHDISLNYPHTVTTYQPYENICPISGRTEVNVTRTGKNLLDWKTVWADYLSDGVLVNPLATVRYTIPSVFIGKQLTFSAKIKANTTTSNCRVICNVNGTQTNGNLINNITDFETSSVTFTPQTESDCIYVASSGVNGTYKELQLEISSTATEYEPYEGDTFNTELGRTVYGGTLDLTTGVLTVNTGYIASYNGETIGEPWISDRDRYVAGTTPTIGAQVVYAKDSETYQVDRTEVDAYFKNNTIWSDSGDVAVSYLVDAKTYIDNH